MIINNRNVDKFADKTVREGARTLFNKIKSPAHLGTAVGLLSFLPAWLAFKLLGRSNIKDATLKALAVSGAAGFATGISATPFRTKEGYTYGENLFGKDVKKNDYYKAVPKTGLLNGYNKNASDLFLKEAADYLADLPNTSKLTLHSLVENTPGFTNPQKDFLHNGIYNTPTNNPNVIDLSGGFSKAVNNITGGLLPNATRAIEGALLGSAFSDIMGVQPGTRKFVTGAAAVADSLWGNKLFNTIPKIY